MSAPETTNGPTSNTTQNEAIRATDEPWIDPDCFGSNWWTLAKIQACLMAADGAKRTEVSRQLGIPSSTIKDWQATPQFGEAKRRIITSEMVRLARRRQERQELADRAIALLERQVARAEAEPDALSLRDVIALTKAVASLRGDCGGTAADPRRIADVDASRICSDASVDVANATEEETESESETEEPISASPESGVPSPAASEELPNDAETGDAAQPSAGPGVDSEAACRGATTVAVDRSIATPGSTSR